MSDTDCLANNPASGANGGGRGPFAMPYVRCRRHRSLFPLSVYAQRAISRPRLPGIAAGMCPSALLHGWPRWCRTVHVTAHRGLCCVAV
jgi:hypothetical protein